MFLSLSNPVPLDAASCAIAVFALLAEDMGFTLALVTSSTSENSSVRVAASILDTCIYSPVVVCSDDVIFNSSSSFSVDSSSSSSVDSSSSYSTDSCSTCSIDSSGSCSVESSNDCSIVPLTEFLWVLINLYLSKYMYDTTSRNWSEFIALPTNLWKKKIVDIEKVDFNNWNWHLLIVFHHY